MRNRLLKRFLHLLLMLFCCLNAPAVGRSDTGVHLHIGIIPHRSHMGNETAYSPLIDALEVTTGYRIDWVAGPTYDAVVELIGTGQVDIAYLGAFAYVDASDRYQVQLIARTVSEGGKAYYRSMIVTRRDSDIKSMADLRGSAFAFTDPKSTSGYLFPMMGLTIHNLSRNDLGQVQFLKRHANSLLAVVNGHVPAGAVSSTAFDKVEVDRNQLRILWRSAPIYRGPWVARRDLPAQIVQELRAALLAISQSPQAAEIFANLGTKGFVKGEDQDYDTIRQVRRLTMQSAPAAR
ncbi:MAG: phosphate/phosphite/phosphonate ABC transporter substrate-binding protein [Desulfosarcinaceae bacterium]|nr:phosphate/phosphite/phosphonate ABC transporter substrate-binding protein [Desulfosarcinaceae bacterium]